MAWEEVLCCPCAPFPELLLGPSARGSAAGKGGVMGTGGKTAPNWYLSHSAAEFQLGILTPAVSSDYLSQL